MIPHKVHLKIVHLEDSLNDAFLIEALLDQDFHNFSITRVDSQEAYLREIQDPGLRIVLSDYSLPGYDGMSALAELRHRRPEVPFIFVSGAMGEDMAVECMKIGATDYILKSNLKRLPSAIRRALRELNARLAFTEAARVAKVVPWSWDDANDTWLFGNLVEDILGFSEGALKYTPGFLKTRIHGEDLPRFAASFALAKERDRVDFDCRFQHADGRWLWTRWILAWSDGRYRGTLQDITELRSAQEALIQSQRLESLAMMIGGITHDFGNLIASMTGAVELLAMGELTERQQRHVDALARSCGRAMEFKNELLRLARKEEAPRRLDVDLNEVAREAAALLVHALPRSVALVFEPGGDLPRVQAVPSQILQVLMNLGINARDALEGQGRIRILTGTEHLAQSGTAGNGPPDGTYAFAEVEDTGPGLSPEVQARMFEPFFTTKAQGEGTGLGLAMVRAIVQQHDGLMKVETELGKGSRFRILLPVVV